MTAEQFKAWMEQMNYTDDQAAQALGVAPTTVRNYKRGWRDGGDRAVEIPTAVALACEHLLIKEAL